MMNVKKQRRDLHGVLLLDKPQQLTSNHALQRVKNLFQAKKAGHTGALDPLATGMLPICFGEATKFSQYLLDSDKRYRVVAKLGERTDTSDAEGTIISKKAVNNIDEPQIEQALTQFRGAILQVPTMFSALKHQGRPLYEYARQGIVIEREAREICIYENRFIHFDANNQTLELEIHCSKGTYIRTIIDDLGEFLGCGAHVIYLRRLQVSTYPINKMVSLPQMQAMTITELDTLLLPVDSPLQDYAVMTLTDEQARDILFGKTLLLSVSNPGAELVRLYHQNRFLGAATHSNHQLIPKRLVVTEN